MDKEGIQVRLHRAEIRPGSKVWFNREKHQVLSLGSTTVLLQALSSRERVTMLVADLLTADDFSMNEEGKRDDVVAEALGTAVPHGVPETALEAARKLLQHILEMSTGYQSGSAADPRPGEPSKTYDPRFTNLTGRVKAKAEELGCKERKLWTDYKCYRSQGLLGLVDHREARTRFAKVPIAISNAITAVIKRRTNEATVPGNRIIQLVKAEVLRNEVPDDFKLPSDMTLRRMILSREDGKLLMASAKRRRNSANRPKVAYTRFHATRPGEVVLIDSTPLDVFALDPSTHEWCSIQLTIAIDLYTRSIVAWRFARETKAVDAALMLADIIRPKRSREFLGGERRKPFVGVPQTIIAHIDAVDDQETAGELVPIPFLHPESLLIDQGKVFLSDTFLAGARHLGINVMLARPYTPTDKAQVERMFRTIRESFLIGMLGYKGADVSSRGKDPEKDAYYYMHEIDDFFCEWVANYWQERLHDGLFLHPLPTVELTPNQMLEEGVARAGFLYVPPDKNFYYELLPVIWRKIHHYGVDNDLLRYDSEALDPFRNEPSGYTDPVNGKWPFRQDPRDKSVLHFWDPDLTEWRNIYWTGAGTEKRPFDDKTLEYAKELTVLRDGKRPSRDSVVPVLHELLDRMSNVSAEKRSQRKLLAKSLHNATLAERDRTVGTPVASPQATQSAQETSSSDGVTALTTRRSRFAYDPVVAATDRNDPEVETSSSIQPLAIKSVDEANEDEDDALSY